MQPDILFVGAGPVGLFTAINAKLENPYLKLLMLERNQEYSRHHILIINKNSYKGSHSDPEFQAILKQLDGAIPTCEIEGQLRAYAFKLGIEMTNAQVINVGNLSKTYPSAHTIIGSDGAKSIVRKQLFNDEKTLDENLQYIVELKYKTSGATEKLSVVNTIEGLGQLSHFVSEHVGKLKNGQTPVSLFFFVDKKTHAEIYAKGAAGIKLTDITAGSREMTALTNSIHPWLAYRRYHQKESLVPGTEKITAVTLGNYKSKTCVKVVDGVRYVLIGDSKLGIPYFRALNAGFIGGVKAAQLICQKEEKNNYKNHQYDADMSALASKEIANAYKKNNKVTLGRIFAGFVRFISLRIDRDFMSPTAKKIMKNARVTPLSFYTTHKLLLAGFLLFLVIASIIAATGGISAVPLGVYLVAHISKVGAILLASAYFAVVTELLYKGFATLISYLRKSHVMTQPPMKRNSPSELDSPIALDGLINHSDEIDNSLRSYSHPAGLKFNYHETTDHSVILDIANTTNDASDEFKPANGL